MMILQFKTISQENLERVENLGLDEEDFVEITSLYTDINKISAVYCDEIKGETIMSVNINGVEYPCLYDEKSFNKIVKHLENEG